MAYSIIVGNVGVITERDRPKALHTYREYVSQSKKGYGRAANESVTLMNGECIEMEYVGKLDGCEIAG